MKDVTSIFPERLKELRDGKTKIEAAEGIGISRVALGYYESGDRNPDYEVLAKIADYYAVSTDYLIGLTDVKNPDISVRVIAEETGLSEEAIGSIRKYNEYSPDLVDALDFLIKNEDFCVALENMSKYELGYMELHYYFAEYEEIKSSGKNLTDDLAKNIFRSDDAESATEYRIVKYLQYAADDWIAEKQTQVNRIPAGELKSSLISVLESML